MGCVSVGSILVEGNEEIKLLNVTNVEWVSIFVVDGGNVVVFAVVVLSSVNENGDYVLSVLNLCK